MRSQDLRGHNRTPRPASPGSTTEVETSHPLLSCTSMVPDDEQPVSPENAQTYPERNGRASHPADPRRQHSRMPDRRSRRMRAHRASAAADRGVDEKPPWALAVAEIAPTGGDRQGRGRGPKSRPRGSTGRVGAGLIGPDLPRDEVRFSSRRLGRNPPSGTPVTRKDAAARRDGCSPSPKSGQRSGQDPAADRSGTGRPARSPGNRAADRSDPGQQIAQIPARRSLRNWPASGAATEPRADLVSSTTAKATCPWKPTKQAVR